MPEKSTHLDRILGRIDDLDSDNLATLVRRLVRERGLLETVFNTIQEGILVVDQSGRVEYANAAAAHLIGLKEKDLGHAVLWKVMPDLSQILDFDREASPAMMPASSRELEITYPEPRFVRLYVVPFETEEEEERQLRYAIIISDITEEKTTTEERIANERISSIFDLAAGVAHELGNPLNSINIHLQLMRRQLSRLGREPATEKIKSSLEACTNEVQRLDGIITHFLQAIRPQPPDLRETDLIETLYDVLNLQGPELHNLNIHVDVEVRADLPPVMADPEQLKQVFFNITKNAMEAMDAGGDLKITAHADDDYVTLIFADTGVGISQQDLPRVFQPYYTSKSGGHGLGMMVVQRIMRDHGGQIGIDSKPGTGTVISLRFPQRHRRMRMLESR
ncbi:PAS domain-containing protein [Ruficoccus amylovorans]|uniref:histidine kinase n=1 Tax=Ruficoccus amylovorans TaxID=1804625 RepID=A0A842HAD9_9BACT|nr:ATP-binding protein [Ruficoccus amylovorans]MBC2593285.1 PAS domain-containing protein [Ruficoccus amylovorans]